MDSYQLLIYSPIESPQSPSLSKVLSYCSWGTVASSFVITTSTQQLNVSKMSRTRCKSKKQNLLAIYKFSYNLLIISLYPIKTLFEILVFHNQVQCRQHLVMNYRPPLFYTALKCFPDWGWTPETFRIKRFLRKKKKKNWIQGVAELIGLWLFVCCTYSWLKFFWPSHPSSLLSPYLASSGTKKKKKILRIIFA